MPLSLDDLRKTTAYGRKDKRRKITPGLIESAQEREMVGDFCRYFGELVKFDKRQRDFSEQYLTERAGGDFKLARGLISALMGFYTWEAETFAEKLNKKDWALMQELGLVTASGLRLALYDYINAGGRSGFVTDEERAETLELFAAGIGLEPGLVEELLFLDAEENARLRLRKRKDGEDFRPPTLGEVVRRYNRMAVETLLYNSSEVVFGFGTTLPGTLIKKIGFLSKELHIPYDLDYNAVGEVQLRLYGPAQAFGPPTRHGERLAKLAFMTLAYARRQNGPVAEAEEYSGPRTTVVEDQKSKIKDRRSKIEDQNPQGRRTASGNQQSAINNLQSSVAQVHIKDKVYYFDLGEVMGKLGPYQPEEDDISLDGEDGIDGEIENRSSLPEDKEIENGVLSHKGEGVRESGVAYEVKSGKRPVKTVAQPEFDSSVEARFYEEFTALAREGHTAGWQLEREPEALALPGHNLLFIPDFALQRGSSRVWLEVIGFWTADYRARKLEKLEKLKGAGDYKLALAVARELEADFHDGQHKLPYPAIFYKGRVRATEVVALLQKHYDDRAGRIGEVESGKAGIEKALAENGFVAEKALYGFLKVYNKTELLAALGKLGGSGVYVENYGLCSRIYLEAAQAALEEILAGQTRLALEEVGAELAGAGLEIDGEGVEALLAQLPGVSVRRPTLFEVFVEKSAVYAAS